jgi:hypothetical protein
MRSIPSSNARRKFNFGNTVEAFLQQDGLPFASVLSADTISSVFEKYAKRVGRIYTHAIVLWAFLSQVLRDGKEASCQSAVARIISHLQRRGQKTPSSDTGDYCRARSKLPEPALKELSCQVADEAEQQSPTNWLWKGRHAKLVDGFTFMMPDTPKNQEEYPQHTAQKPGLGFPIARVVGLISLATGCVLEATMGPYKGKETGETALFRRLLSFVVQGDVVVADRYYCAYWLVATLQQLGIDVCFRKVEKRAGTFTKGKRLGKGDHLMTWHRPSRPQWMSKEMYESLPESIEVRQMRYTVATPGRKQEPYIILTTMTHTTGDKGVSYDEIAELYSFRWHAELDIRCIKTYLNLHDVRCKSPEMVHREFWTSLLAYNLIRVTLAMSATLHDKKPRELSFVSGCQFVLAAWQELPHITNPAERMAFCLALLERLSTCEVGNRPGRFEPRVVKKRRDRYRLMQQPRNELRERLKNGDNLFEK